MSRYAIVNHLDSSKRFVVLIEEDDGVRTLGVSPAGKEWERWADSRPPQDRRTIEQLLRTLGAHLQIEGPANMSRVVRTEMDSLLKEDASEAIDATVAGKDDVN